MPTWLRNPVGGLLVVALLLGVISALALGLDIGRPFGGYSSYLLIQSLRTVPIAETPPWWPVYRTPLTPSDVFDLLTVNGRSHRTDALAAFEQARRDGDTWATLRVHSLAEDRVFSVRVPVIRFGFMEWLELKLPDLIVGLCFWLAAVTVLKARPSEPLNQVFATATVLIALHRWLAVHSIWTDARLLPTWLTAIQLAVSSFVGPALIHFALLFPTRVKWWPGWLLALAYVCGAASAVILAVARLLVSGRSNVPTRLSVVLTAYQVMLFLYLIGLVLLLARLASFWLRARQARRERRMALILFLSLAAVLPLLLTFAGAVLPGVSEDQSRFWNSLDLRYLLSVVPLALAFVIVRYQSMRSPSRLLVLVSVLAGSALLAAVLSWLWGLAQADWPASGEHPPFPYLFAGILAASLFWSSQANWRGWFGRLLEWDTQSYAATRAFGRRVAGTTQLGELSQAIAGALVEEMHLARAAVWLWQPEAQAYDLAAEAGEAGPPLLGRLPAGAAAEPADSAPLRLYAPDDVPVWLLPLRQTKAIDVVVPLNSDRRPVGLLGLGHRWDEEIFDDRDLVIAELVGQQATLFLLAAQQLQELRAVPQRVVAAQEGERRRLAAELHDTVQQFLGGLPFALSFTPEQIHDDPDGVAGALSRCLNDVEAMAETVRRIRFNLAPSQLEASLVRSVRELVDRVVQRHGLHVILAVDDGIDEATTLATRGALYRVIQQALDNVVAHAAATEVQVRLACADGRVVLSVADNGRGSSAAARQDAARRDRSGLASMRARLEMVGGGFAFESSPGAGTVVSGWAPVH